MIQIDQTTQFKIPIIAAKKNNSKIRMALLEKEQERQEESDKREKLIELVNLLSYWSNDTSIGLYVYRSIYLSIYASIYISFYISIYQSFHLTYWIIFWPSSEPLSTPNLVPMNITPTDSRANSFMRWPTPSTSCQYCTF